MHKKESLLLPFRLLFLPSCSYKDKIWKIVNLHYYHWKPQLSSDALEESSEGKTTLRS